MCCFSFICCFLCSHNGVLDVPVMICLIKKYCEVVKSNVCSHCANFDSVPFSLPPVPDRM